MAAKPLNSLYSMLANMLRASATGEFILFGEYAVVYGKPAVAIAPSGCGSDMWCR